MSIVLKDLVKRYGHHTVVDRVSLEIEEGELFVLLGASGSGKSTVLRMIAGLVPVDDGRVLLHGEDVTDWSPQTRNLGLVFQNYSLFPHMTVAENVEFGLAVRKVDAAERVERRDELLALVGLAGLGRRNVRRLSGGQQQRVAVARALAFSPSVLLLDEPFGALDVKIRSQLRRSLKEIQERLGVTSILVTHDQEEAFELADRIGVIERGRLLEVGAPGDLYRRPRHQFVASFIGDANLLGVRRQEGELRLGPLRLPLPPDPPDLQPAVGWAVLLRPEDLSLTAEDEDVDGLELGVGRIEEALALGSVERVRVRMDPLPGAWPITPHFGSPGIPLWVSLPGTSNGGGRTRIGRTVRIGVKAYHLVPRLTLRLLLCVEKADQLPLVVGLATDLSKDLRGQLTVACVARDESAGQRLAAETEEAFAQRAAPLDMRVLVGPPTREILREAHSGAYDLLVLPGPGRCRRTGLRSLGILEEVIHETPLPVLIANGKDDVRRVLMCTAAGEAGKRDVAFGAQMARATGAEATLLYVDPRPDVSPATDPPGWVRRHLEQASEVVRAHGVQAEARVRHGPVVPQILEETEEGSHDLIVLGGHQPGTWPDRTKRNVALELVQKASQNVLIVHDLDTGGVA
ncbi:MAG TPA: ATP-binding cassette domain-containing protein [Gemmatimonadota bacterium]|nr:ATP-binding cassette domain-containing protein [Gemmatimonadota bacterium]